MKICRFEDRTEADHAAADLVAGWLAEPEFRHLMVAAGNTPLPLYGLIAAKRLALPHLHIHMLDEYVGVPVDEPRNCANLLRTHVAAAWGIPGERYHTISSHPDHALATALAHQQRIETAGGLDAVILGLGQNGHLGFNEPGSPADSGARLVPLETISVEANRLWFGGAYAPNTGITVGLKTLLQARRVIVLAYGPHKAAPVAAMAQSPPSVNCPASLLQSHPACWLFIDASAGSRLATIPA
ncbi:MAG: 6-phosphogluconolactonase [Verrucomicrobiales bacterium]|nr:6-phosphogluconolactonase [Verrucomicrobiales bacterium]